MNEKLGMNWLRKRQDSFLADHYLGMHVTIISLALATAGVAAASLITRPENSPAHLALLWLLWSGSLLAASAAYGGAMVGAFALPPFIPSTADLLLPLSMGVTEFLLFTVLIRQVTSAIQFDKLVTAWFAVMAIFGFIAWASVLRARSLFARAMSDKVYSGRAKGIIQNYISLLRFDLVGTASVFFVAAIAALLRFFGLTSEYLAYSATSLLLLVLIGSLISQYWTGKIWRKHLG